MDKQTSEKAIKGEQAPLEADTVAVSNLSMRYGIPYTDRNPYFHVSPLSKLK